ncbi:MAG: FAD-dependent oxidoreductase [Gammaproteobacteria bacterium]|nr:MAG: FAD-dependent oxidoreductase [Gammaproteobacteria bacterium]
MAYYDNPSYIPLLQSAYRNWKQLEKKANKKFLIENGILEIAFATAIKTKINFLKKYHIPFELLNSKEMSIQFPDFFLPKDMMGLFQPQGGFLYIDQCIQFFIDESIALGAQIFSQEKVKTWNIETNGKVLVKTDKDIYQSKYLIFTSSAWTNELLPELNLNLEILQKKLVWSSACSNYYSIKKNSPCFAYHLGHDLFYGFPNINGFIKVSRHTGGSIFPSSKMMKKKLL